MLVTGWFSRLNKHPIRVRKSAHPRRVNPLSSPQDWILEDRCVLSFIGGRGMSGLEDRDDIVPPRPPLLVAQQINPLTGVQIPGSFFLTDPPGSGNTLPKDPLVPDPQGKDINNVLGNLLYVDGVAGPVPIKTVTVYNNTNQTLYPFLYDSNNKGNVYDPLDKFKQEYRIYIGYEENGQKFLGLQAHRSMVVTVPLVFWDSGRMAIATDGATLLPTFLTGANKGKVNTSTNKNTQGVENPFHFEYYGLDGNPTPIVVVNKIDVQNLQTNTHTATGVLMYYHCTDQPGEDPGLDDPDQLVEFTIRDKAFLTAVNQHGGAVPDNQLKTLINYDVSYVDHLLLPVGMEATNVPVIDPFPSPDGTVLTTKESFGVLGASNPYLGPPPSIQAALADFTSNDPLKNGLGQYFAGMGWPTFWNPDYTPQNQLPGIRIPGGANIFLLSPLANRVSSFAQPYGPINHWMLSSGGNQAIKYSGGGSLLADKQTLQLLFDNTPQGLAARDALIAGLKPPNTSYTWFVSSTNYAGEPIAGTLDLSTIKIISNTEIQIKLLAPAPAPYAPGGLSFDFKSPVNDPYATQIRSIWYSWAQYYHDLYSSFTPETITATVKNDTDAKLAPAFPIPINDTRILTNFTAPTVPLALGMQLTKIDGAAPPTLITILKISADQKTIYLSQPVSVAPDSIHTFEFSAPPAPSTFTADSGTVTTFNIDPTKNFNQWKPFGVGGIAAANQFAGDVYEVMSIWSTVAPDPGLTLSPSMQLMVNVIGGNVGFLPTAQVKDPNKPPDGEVAFQNISADARDTLKSALRGVPDFNDTTKYPESLWYPDPALKIGGREFNVFNLDPYVWFVHEKLGLSGYGFSFDDDAADVGADLTNSLAIAIGGTTGLPNQKQYFPSTPYGTGLTSQATIRLSDSHDLLPLNTPILRVQDKIVYHQVKATDVANALTGAFVSGGTLAKGTQIVGYGDNNAQEFILSANVTAAVSTPFTITFTGKPK